MNHILSFIITMTVAVLVCIGVICFIAWVAADVNKHIATFLLIATILNGTNTISDPIAAYICKYFNLEPSL